MTTATKASAEITLGSRVLKDSSTTFGWFVRNRYFPLREGDWRPETAKVKKIQIEEDLLTKFEDQPLDSIDRFMLQTHVNDLAKRTRTPEEDSWIRATIATAF